MATGDLRNRIGGRTPEEFIALFAEQAKNLRPGLPPIEVGFTARHVEELRTINGRGCPPTTMPLPGKIRELWAGRGYARFYKPILESGDSTGN